MAALILDRKIEGEYTAELLRLNYPISSDIVNTIDEFKKKMQEKDYDLVVLEPCVILGTEPNMPLRSVGKRFRELLLDKLYGDFDGTILIMTVCHEALRDLQGLNIKTFYRRPLI